MGGKNIRVMVELKAVDFSLFSHQEYWEGRRFGVKILVALEISQSLIHCVFPLSFGFVVL